MATLTILDLSLPDAVEQHERRIIEANRRLAELAIVRRDYRHLPDGMQRFLRAVRSMEQQGLQS